MVAAAPENRELTVWAALATALLSIAFGGNAVAIKLSLASFGPFTAAALRFAVAAAVVAAWASLAGEPLRLDRARLRRLLVLCAVLTVQIGAFYVGLRRTYASRSTLIANLQPFLVLLLAHYLLPGERITVRRLFGIAFGFAGVIAVLSETAGLSAQLRTGDIVVLGAVLLWAGNTVWAKRIVDDYNAFQFSFYPMVVAVPPLAVAALLFDRPLAGHVSAAALGGLAYQTIVTASIGFVAWNALFRRYGAVAVNSFTFLQPVAGVGLGALVLGEPVGTRSLLFGLPLVVVGILLTSWGGRAPVAHGPGPDAGPET